MWVIHNVLNMNTLRLTYVPTEKEAKKKNAIIEHGLFLTHVVPLSKNLKKNGANTIFFSKGEEKKGEKFEGFQVLRTKKPQQPFFMIYGKDASKRLEGIDLVHAHNPAYAYYFGVNRKALGGRPIVITWHGFFPYKKYKLGVIHKFFLSKLAKFAHFVAINQPSIEQLKELGVPKSRINFITTGYDPK